jgi:subtilisin family serine protease
MLPLEPADDIDEDLGNGQAHPNGDETDADDGWAAISGTSAAAPQLAGTAALVRQVGPQLTPAEVRDVLMASAQDVTAGTCHPRMNNAAMAGPDLATGNGLVDAARAVLIAKLRSQRVPALATSPPYVVGPATPIVPGTHISPVMPVPARIAPAVPITPFSPIGLGNPIGSIATQQPILGSTSQSAEPKFERIPLSAEDVVQLEEILRDYPQR